MYVFIYLIVQSKYDTVVLFWIFFLSYFRQMIFWYSETIMKHLKLAEEEHLTRGKC